MKKALLVAAPLFCAVGQPVLAQDSAVTELAWQEDAQRLETARATVDHIFPKGTYARLMKGSMDAVMDGMTASMADMPMAQIAQIAGLPEEELAAMGDATMAQVMEIVDPHFQERTRLGMDAMMNSMATLMTKFEPSMRAGLSRAYASRFTTSQLEEMNAFFATETGSLYAAESMAIFMDPEVMAEMRAMMPKIMEGMPEMLAAVEAATAHLPKARTFKDLSDEEVIKLAEVLGTDTLGADD